MHTCVLPCSIDVIPTNSRAEASAMVHEGHREIDKIKSYARGYVYSPRSDDDNERTRKSCIICQQSNMVPAHDALPEWPRATRSLEVVHAEFAGSLYGVTFLLRVDSISK